MWTWGDVAIIGFVNRRLTGPQRLLHLSPPSPQVARAWKTHPDNPKREKK
jgi:hypothetical protein